MTADCHAREAGGGGAWGFYCESRLGSGGSILTVLTRVQGSLMAHLAQANIETEEMVLNVEPSDKVLRVTEGCCSMFGFPRLEDVRWERGGDVNSAVKRWQKRTCCKRLTSHCLRPCKAPPCYLEVAKSKRNLITIHHIFIGFLVTGTFIKSKCVSGCNLSTSNTDKNE